MDYMRDLAARTLPWFSAKGKMQRAPKDDLDKDIDAGDVQQFVSEVEQRLKPVGRTASWEQTLADAGLRDESKGWWDLWKARNEQTCVELLADVFYLDACRPGTEPPLAQRASWLLNYVPPLLIDVAREQAKRSNGKTDLESLRVRARDLLSAPSDVRQTLLTGATGTPFEIVFERELAHIERSRSARTGDDTEAAIARTRRQLSEYKQQLMIEETSLTPGERGTARASPESSAQARIARLEELIADCKNRLGEELEQDAKQRVDYQVGPRVSLDTGPADKTSGIFRYPLRRAQSLGLLGLAFSGGGIRSATFNLGILQALADVDLLRRFDYLSTVSGGGYIGGWLAGCVKQEPDGIRDVQRWLSSARSPDPEAPDRRPLRFLREYSNYLTPVTGFFSADTWTMAAIWLRNTLLNQLVLVLFLGAVLLLPIALGATAAVVDAGWPSRNIAMGIAALLLIGASWYTGMNIRTFDTDWLKERALEVDPTPRRVSHQPWWAAQGPIQIGITVPILLGSFLLVWPLVHAANPRPEDTPGWLASLFPRIGPYLGAVTIVAGLFACLTIVHLVGKFEKCFFAGQPQKPWRASVAAVSILVCSLFASAAGGALLIVVAKGASALGWFDASRHVVTPKGMWQIVTFGPPVVVLALTMVVTVHIGLLGVNFPDMRREWWSRLGAWTLIYSAAWMTICLLSIWSPLWVHNASRQVATAGGLTWLVTTVAGVLTGRSAKTLPGTSFMKEGGWRNVIAVVAPYVFAVGLLILVAVGMRALYDAIRDQVATPARGDYWQQISNFGWTLLPLALAIGSAGLSLLLAWRIDVNEFSMHHFYRNRLVRCYLGATRKERTRYPNRFTGFDPDDDPKLSDLATGQDGKPPWRGPYPIFNATLNVVRGSDLAAQERKGESFILSPLYCGYNFVVRERVSEKANERLAVNGYRPTKQSAYGDQRGMSLGTAIAISGAAANPNMGYHSSPAVAFLMTVFNARLGWWVGNPRHKKTWRRAAPRLGLLYHIAELTGNTSDRRSYVNLSDGGHFENLGIYELVRRRCRFIVACDSEEDAKSRFGGLGGVVRKCRADFGIDIDIRYDRLRPIPGANGARSPAHCVVGTIHYPGDQCGTLLYIKSTLSGDEPADVSEYAGRETAFPHQSTADQWFNESQFESYRALGHHVGTLALQRATKESEEATKGSAVLDTEQLFSRLFDQWYPPSPAIAAHFVDHARSYDALLERVRTDKSLTSFDHVLFPSLNGNGAGNPRFARDLFYTYQAMIELMQSVYIDLELDENLDHPHNAGWMRIFRQWIDGKEFKEAWEASRETYSKRFRHFCASEFGLPE